MRVLLLAENWEPRIGGIERYLKGIADTLHEGGFEVFVVAPRTANQESEIGNYQILRKRFFWPFIKPSWLPLFIWLWKFVQREKIDAVLCGKGLFEGLIGYYLKRHLGIPFIVFTYAMEIEAWRKNLSQAKKLQRVLAAANGVAYINDKTRETLVSLGVKNNQLLKVMPAVEPWGGSVREAVKGGQYILSVGRLIPRKGFDTLLEAFAQLDVQALREIQLWIVGTGPEEKRLRELAASLDIADRVRFLGAVSDIELRDLYARAEVFALTPRNIHGDVEGFGIVYLEAALAGLPAVATRSGGVPEAVIHNETGLLVASDDAEAAAVALMQILLQPELRKRLGKQAERRAREEFSWSKRIQPLVQTLHALLPSSAG